MDIRRIDSWKVKEMAMQEVRKFLIEPAKWVLLTVGNIRYDDRKGVLKLDQDSVKPFSHIPFRKRTRLIIQPITIWINSTPPPQKSLLSRNLSQLNLCREIYHRRSGSKMQIKLQENFLKKLDCSLTF